MPKEKPFQPTSEQITKATKTFEVMAKRGTARDSIREVIRLLQDPDSFGVQKDHAADAQKVLDTLLTRPSIFTEDLEELRPLLRQESQVARAVEKKQAENQRQSRRKFIQTATGLVFAGSAVGVVNTTYTAWWESNYSPEAIEAARIREEDRQRLAEEKKQREIAEKRAFEDSITLGEKWSDPSSYSWRFRHPPLDPKIAYEEIIMKDSSKIIASSDGFYFPMLDKEESRGLGEAIFRRVTFGVKPGTHLLVDGNLVPKLTVITPQNLPNVDLLIRQRNDQTFDTSVVHAQDIETKRERFLKIETIPSKTDILRITLMQAVQK